MDIQVQSFLNSATKLTIAVTNSTTVTQLKNLVYAAEGTTSTYMQFYFVNTATTVPTVLANTGTMSTYGITTGSYINSSNTISTSTNTKEARQIAKLELAKLRRTSAGNTTTNYYRQFHTYDRDLLADKYVVNALAGSTSTLASHRPWI